MIINKKKMNKKGVSLLVLSIAIIIMAILASTAIMTLEDTDVVETSKDAVKASSKEAVKERLENLKNTYIVDNFGNADMTGFIEFLQDEGEVVETPTINADGSYAIKTISNYFVTIVQDGESNLIITVD